MNADIDSPACWRLPRWPELDRALWNANCVPGDPFDDPHYGAGLRADSRLKTEKGYGRWLSFLASRAWLDPAQRPLERVTRPRLRAYFQELRKIGNADYTVIGRFNELTMAMKILAPAEDSSWISRPYGNAIRASLPRKKRSVIVPDSTVLFKWAVGLMDGANNRPTSRARACGYRNGLFLAILASRGRRLRSMTLLRIGHEFIKSGDSYRIELAPDQVKTGKSDRFDLPSVLVPYIDRYLSEVRQALLRGSRHDYLWVNTMGRPMSSKLIQNEILDLTLERFGTAFGPHRCRHAIATTASLQCPDRPGLAAAMLGISTDTIEQSYDRAGQVQATNTYKRLITRRRTQPESF